MQCQGLDSGYTLGVWRGAAQRESRGEGALGSRGEGEAGETQQSLTCLLTCKKTPGQ